MDVLSKIMLEQTMAVGQVRETLNDLEKVHGKAELIGGRIFTLMPTGAWPSEIAGNIYESLKAHSRRIKKGKAFTDNVGYVVPELSSGRESFSPDTSYFEAIVPRKSLKFIAGPPTLAVEVRSQEDYGPAADEELAAKRADYFEAGTKVVWDVDPKAETIAVYLGPTATPAKVFRHGDTADAEPAVPGWTIAVADVFAED